MSNETYLPAKQKKAKKYFRVPQKNVDRERPQAPHTPSSQGSQTPCARLKKPSRLLKRWEFQSMQKGAAIFRGSTLFVACKRHLDTQRKMGITATKHFGNAVKRNRFKRLVREAFRLMQHDFPQNLTMVIKPKKGCVDPSFGEIQNDLQRLASELSQPPAKARR